MRTLDGTRRLYMSGGSSELSTLVDVDWKVRGPLERRVRIRRAFARAPRARRAG